MPNRPLAQLDALVGDSRRAVARLSRLLAAACEQRLCEARKLLATASPADRSSIVASLQKLELQAANLQEQMTAAEQRIEELEAEYLKAEQEQRSE